MSTRKELNIMTGFNNNNKLVPTAPKTYEVRYLENKEPSKLVQFASYLGISKVYNCDSCPEGSAGRDKIFRLDIVLRNMLGASIPGTAYNTAGAASLARDIVAATGH